MLGHDESFNPHMNPISGDTLSKLIQNDRDYLIIDCRFRYEFEAGHIKNAINISSPSDLEAFFFGDRLTNLMKQRTIIVFHCEFSRKRAPDLWSTLRNLDRLINIEKYPQLCYPESYVLEGGFSQFFERY